MAEEKKRKPSRSEKMYADSPSLKRDEKDDKVKATKPSEEKKEADEVQGGTDGADRGNGDMDARHAMDRLSMFHKHEGEHMAHKEGDKKDLHKRHIEEQKATHKRHQKEYGSGGGEVIDKTEETSEE